MWDDTLNSFKSIICQQFHTLTNFTGTSNFNFGLDTFSEKRTMS